MRRSPPLGLWLLAWCLTEQVLGQPNDEGDLTEEALDEEYGGEDTGAQLAEEPQPPELSWFQTLSFNYSLYLGPASGDPYLYENTPIVGAFAADLRHGRVRLTAGAFGMANVSVALTPGMLAVRVQDMAEDGSESSECLTLPLEDDADSGGRPGGSDDAYQSSYDGIEKIGDEMCNRFTFENANEDPSDPASGGAVKLWFSRPSNKICALEVRSPTKIGDGLGAVISVPAWEPSYHPEGGRTTLAGAPTGWQCMPATRAKRPWLAVAPSGISGLPYRNGTSLPAAVALSMLAEATGAVGLLPPRAWRLLSRLDVESPSGRAPLLVTEQGPELLVASYLHASYTFELKRRNMRRRGVGELWLSFDNGTTRIRFTGAAHSARFGKGELTVVIDSSTKTMYASFKLVDLHSDQCIKYHFPSFEDKANTNRMKTLWRRMEQVLKWQKEESKRWTRDRKLLAVQWTKSYVLEFMVGEDINAITGFDLRNREAVFKTVRLQRPPEWGHETPPEVLEGMFVPPSDDCAWFEDSPDPLARVELRPPHHKSSALNDLLLLLAHSPASVGHGPRTEWPRLFIVLSAITVPGDVAMLIEDPVPPHPELRVGVAFDYASTVYAWGGNVTADNPQMSNGSIWLNLAEQAFRIRDEETQTWMGPVYMDFLVQSGEAARIYANFNLTAQAEQQCVSYPYPDSEANRSKELRGIAQQGLQFLAVAELQGDDCGIFVAPLARGRWIHLWVDMSKSDLDAIVRCDISKGGEVLRSTLFLRWSGGEDIVAEVAPKPRWGCTDDPGPEPLARLGLTGVHEWSSELLDALYAFKELPSEFAMLEILALVGDVNFEVTHQPDPPDLSGIPRLAYDYSMYLGPAEGSFDFTTAPTAGSFEANLRQGSVRMTASTAVPGATNISVMLVPGSLAVRVSESWMEAGQCLTIALEDAGIGGSAGLAGVRAALAATASFDGVESIGHESCNRFTYRSPGTHNASTVTFWYSNPRRKICAIEIRSWGGDGMGALIYVPRWESSTTSGGGGGRSGLDDGVPPDWSCVPASSVDDPWVSLAPGAPTLPEAVALGKLAEASDALGLLPDWAPEILSRLVVASPARSKGTAAPPSGGPQRVSPEFIDGLKIVVNNYVHLDYKFSLARENMHREGLGSLWVSFVDGMPRMRLKGIAHSSRYGDGEITLVVDSSAKVMYAYFKLKELHEAQCISYGFPDTEDRANAEQLELLRWRREQVMKWQASEEKDGSRLLAVNWTKSYVLEFLIDSEGRRVQGVDLRQRGSNRVIKTVRLEGDAQWSHEVPADAYAMFDPPREDCTPAADPVDPLASVQLVPPHRKSSALNDLLLVLADPSARGDWPHLFVLLCAITVPGDVAVLIEDPPPPRLDNLGGVGFDYSATVFAWGGRLMSDTPQMSNGTIWLDLEEQAFRVRDEEVETWMGPVILEFIARGGDPEPKLYANVNFTTQGEHQCVAYDYPKLDNASHEELEEKSRWGLRFYALASLRGEDCGVFVAPLARGRHLHVWVDMESKYPDVILRVEVSKDGKMLRSTDVLHWWTPPHHWSTHNWGSMHPAKRWHCDNSPGDHRLAYLGLKGYHDWSIELIDTLDVLRTLPPAFAVLEILALAGDVNFEAKDPDPPELTQLEKLSFEYRLYLDNVAPAAGDFAVDLVHGWVRMASNVGGATGTNLSLAMGHGMLAVRMERPTAGFDQCLTIPVEGGHGGGIAANRPTPAVATFDGVGRSGCSRFTFKDTRSYRGSTVKFWFNKATDKVCALELRSEARNGSTGALIYIPEWHPFYAPEPWATHPNPHGGGAGPHGAIPEDWRCLHAEAHSKPWLSLAPTNAERLDWNSSLPEAVALAKITEASDVVGLLPPWAARSLSRLRIATPRGSPSKPAAETPGAAAQTPEAEAVGIFSPELREFSFSFTSKRVPSSGGSGLEGGASPADENRGSGKLMVDLENRRLFMRSQAANVSAAIPLVESDVVLREEEVSRLFARTDIRSEGFIQCLSAQGPRTAPPTGPAPNPFTRAVLVGRSVPVAAGTAEGGTASKYVIELDRRKTATLFVDKWERLTAVSLRDEARGFSSDVVIHDWKTSGIDARWFDTDTSHWPCKDFEFPDYAAKLSEWDLLRVFYRVDPPASASRPGAQVEDS